VSPTVLQSGPYRFFFFASDRSERQHVHAARDDKAGKFWLSPVEVAHSHGFDWRELRRIERIVRQHEPELLEAWNEYFKGGDRSGKSDRRQGH
jgi:hypothetical protein